MTQEYETRSAVDKFLLDCAPQLGFYTKGDKLMFITIKELQPCLRDLANTRIREPDSQEMAGSCLAREKIRFSGLVCSRLAFLI